MNHDTHTPGPWRREGHHVISDGNFDAYVKGVRFDAIGDFAANAQLMSAAPDLLTACRLAREWLDGWASAEPYRTILDEAIAKAEGRT